MDCFYRQYKKIAKDFYFIGQADIAGVFGNGSSKSIPSSTTQNYKQSGGQLFLSTGVSYAVLKKLQIEITLPNLLGIQFNKITQTDSPPNAATQEQKNFTFNSSLTNSNVIGNLGVGFRLIF